VLQTAHPRRCNPARAVIAALAIFVVGNVRAAASATTAAATYAGAEVCAGCHAAEYEQWQHSKHAGAFSPTFESYWQQRDRPAECLACHTTGWSAATGQFAMKGVACESCHGALDPNHPDGATMSLPVDSSMCQRCHQQTYLEWQVSKHAAQNIRCFDCHEVHRQGLRQADAERQCGACHAQRLEDFAHATHHEHGLTCTTCHMPQARTTGIGGTGAPGHSFFVGAETCAACHEEMVHKSHKMTSMAQELNRLSHASDVDVLERMGGEVRGLEVALDVQRARTIKWSVGTLLLGLAIGIAVGVRNSRNGAKGPR